MENVFSEKLLHPDGPNCLKDKNDNLNNFAPLYTTSGPGRGAQLMSLSTSTWANPGETSP